MEKMFTNLKTFQGKINVDEKFWVKILTLGNITFISTFFILALLAIGSDERNYKE